jgi:Protein of unknown function (DUF2946)
MRRRLRKLLPIVLIALTVQIFPPIVACWAVGVAAADPLQIGVICHDDGTSGQTDQTGQACAHDGCCAFCSVAHASALFDAPQESMAAPYLQSSRVVWLDFAPDLSGSQIGSHAQARAPPSIS